MGEVYRAIDKATGMVVAIKRMLVEAPSQGADDSALYHAQRFEEECKLLQNLKFPGIPCFVDSFSDGDRRVIVMEFIEGVDLEKQVMDQLALAGEDLPVMLAVEYTIQVAKILEYLHAYRPRPIIHRDVKPANIIVRHSDNRLYLVDFGLAREVGGGSTTKTAVGTVGYAPLEQYKGHPTTRSDQYSLGVTLHFMLSGTQPLPLQVEPLDKLKPDLPHELCWVVRKSTQQDQEERFDSVYEFRRELEKLLPNVQQYQLRKQAKTAVQDRLDLMGPTQELADVYAPAERSPMTIPGQRVKIEGIHRTQEDPMANFGLYNPLENSRTMEPEFQRQALQADFVARSAVSEVESNSPGFLASWKAWVLILAVLFGLFGVYGLNQRQQLLLAREASRDKLTCLKASGLFRIPGQAGIGLGRSGMGWIEYIFSFPHPDNDGMVYSLQPGKVKRVKLKLNTLEPGREAPLRVFFCNAEMESLSAYLFTVKGNEVQADILDGQKSKVADLGFSAQLPRKSSHPVSAPLLCPAKASNLVVLLPGELATPVQVEMSF